MNPCLCLALAPLSGNPAPVDPTAVSLLDDKPVMHQWTGAVSASLIATDGNTETNAANATADAQYRREKDRSTLGFFWNYQDDDTGVLQRRTGGKAKYDYFFSPKTYGLAQTSAENDKQADLALRWIIGVGAGEQFVETKEHKFSGELGLSWFDEDFNASPDDSYLAARAAYTFDWNINESWNFLQTAEIYPSLENSDDVYSKLDTRLKVTLTKKMFAQAQWVMDWDNTPAAGKERVDDRYILTIGWSF